MVKIEIDQDKIIFHSCHMRPIHSEGIIELKLSDYASAPPRLSLRELVSREEPKGLKTLTLLFFLIISALNLFPHTAQSAEIKRVLILNSFHPEYIWTEKSLKGIQEAFQESGLRVETYTAFMDLKRVKYTDAYMTTLQALYRERYREIRFDAILACDNDAFNFLQSYRDDLFPGAPVVFSAINNFEPAMLEGRKDITGYPENTDYKSTLHLALKLRPKTKRVLVVSDATTTGLAHVDAVRKIAPSFGEALRFDYLSVGDFTFEEVGNRLASLREDSIVLLLHHFMDKTNETQPVEIGTPFLTSRCAVPCFVVADIRVGAGALGGCVVSGYHYGRAVAMMVVDILKGTPVEKIPLGVGPNQNMFDHRAMKRFGLSDKDLPQGGIILNRPASILNQYRHEIFILAAAIAILCVLLVVMAIEMIHRRRIETSLSESEERLRLTTDNLPDSYVYQYTYTAEGKPRFLFVSKGVERIHPGVKAEDVLKDAATLHNLIDPGQISTLMEAEAASARNLSDFSMELRFQNADGKERWLHARSRTRRNDLGQVFWEGAAVDITDRKATEQALREFKEIFALFMKHSPIYTYIKEVTPSESRVLQASDNFQDMIGVSGSAMIGKRMPELFKPEFAHKITMDDWEAVSKGKVLKFEEELNGRTYATIKFPLRIGHQSSLLAGYTIDITERKMAEDVLRQRAEWTRTILLTAMEGFWLVDMEGRIVDVNDSYCRMSGYEASELLGMGIEDLEVSQTKADIENHTRQVMEKGGERFESRHRRKSGEVYDIEVSLRYLPMEGGRMVAFMRDISDRKRSEERLLEQKRFYENIVENIQTGVWVTDSADVLRYFNRQMATISGIGPEEAIGFRVLVDFPENTFTHFRPLYIQAKESRSPVEYTAIPVLTPSGREAYQSGWIIPLFQEGLFSGMICTVEDVTRRTQAELKLDKREEEYRLLFETMAQGVVYHAPDGRIVSANPAAMRILGLTQDQILGRTSCDPGWRTIHEDGSAFPGEIHPAMTALQSGLPVSNVIMGVCTPHTGEIRWININARPQFKSGEEKPYQVYATFEDITERRDAEEALRQSHRRYQQLVDNARDAIFTLNTDGRFAFVNARTCDMLGYGPEDLLGRHILETYPEEGREEGQNRMAHIGKGETARFIRPMVRKDGRLVMVEASAWKTAEGHFQAIVRDISDRIQAEEEKARLQAQLNQSQKMESVGRLAGGVAHDFNNMLGVILGNCELALDEADPSQPIFNELMEIRKAGQRSAELTRQLLAFARKQTVAPKLLELNETVEGMLKMLRRLIGEDIDLVWLPGRHLGKIKVDPSQIDQILVNLCINAKDAVGGVGKITIETGRVVVNEAYCAGHPDAFPGDFLFLAVSDTGCGMDPDTLSHLFEPFFTTKELGRGTGLGLATVYGIVGQNNGFIDVKSRPGMGATFTIYLPQAESPDAVSHATPDPEKPAERGHETILMVEDEPAILKMTTKMLTLQGYTVLVAETPSEAIRLAEENAGVIDLLMADVIMPEMNGRALAENLVKRFPGLRCLFMSGYTADVIAHHGVLDEGVSFIQKPFTTKALAHKVRETLSGSAYQAE